MRRILPLAFLLATTSAYAKQHIKCASYDSHDRVIINIDLAGATFLLTTEENANPKSPNPSPLTLKTSNKVNSIYTVKGPEVVHEVHIPQKVLGKISTGFISRFVHTKLKDNFSYERKMSCYSTLEDH